MLHIRRDLPNGEQEPDMTARLTAWSQIQDKAAHLMDVVPYGLDPMVSFSIDATHSGRKIELTPEAAIRLASWHDILKDAGLLWPPGTTS
jgi:hypothetical protein